MNGVNGSWQENHELQSLPEESGNVSIIMSTDLSEAGDGTGLDDGKTNRSKIDASQRNVNSHNQRKLQKEEKMYGKDARSCCPLKCNAKVPRNLALNTRQYFTELTRKEQDIVLLGYLQSHQRTPLLKNYYAGENKTGSVRKHSKAVDSFKRTVRYFYCDIKICRNFFFFLYDIGESRLKNLARHLREKNLTIRKHGSLGKRSTNEQVITLLERQSIVKFITKYAETHGQMPDSKNNKKRVLKLPATITRSKMYRLYCDVIKESQNASCASAAGPSTECSTEQLRLVGPRSFENIWKSDLPHIVTTRPAKNPGDTRKNAPNRRKPAKKINTQLSKSLETT